MSNLVVERLHKGRLFKGNPCGLPFFCRIVRIWGKVTNLFWAMQYLFMRIIDVRR